MSRKSDASTFMRMATVLLSWAAVLWFSWQKHSATEVPAFPESPATQVESVDSTESANQSNAATFKVISITDGDTADILKDGKPLRLRFAGIDTPEKGQPFGNNAKQALSDRIGGKFVRVVVHETDRYGRAIADVYDE